MSADKAVSKKRKIPRKSWVWEKFTSVNNDTHAKCNKCKFLISRKSGNTKK